MKKLAAISEAYIAKNCGDMPAAIIQHASLPQKKMAIGQAKDLVQMAADHGLKHPSLIIIGQVVNVANSQYVAEHMEELILKKTA